MVHRPGDPQPDSPRWFRDDVRCCSYHPRMPNFLVGRALLDGGVGREKMLARIELRSGVTALGIAAPKDWQADYAKQKGEFGRLVNLRCPYWVGGEEACGIWRARGAVCRTWHCKHVDGPRGLRYWNTTKLLLLEIEERLALHCCKRGQVPKGRLSVDAWASWFEWCARKVSTMTTDEAFRERGDKIDAFRTALRARHGRLSDEIPDVLAPAVSRMDRGDDGVTRLMGYSVRDDHVADGATFMLMSKLDGERTWQEGLELAEAELGEPIGEELVHDLWRLGLLREHTDADRPPPDLGLPGT